MIFAASCSTYTFVLSACAVQTGGLGVHLTLDMGGGVRFGPDVEWIDAIDYTVSLVVQLCKA